MLNIDLLKDGVMVVSHTSAKVCKLRVYTADHPNALTYDFVTPTLQIPAMYGSNKYILELCEHTTGNRYKRTAVVTKKVELEDETAPFLASTSFVNYKGSTYLSEIAIQAKSLVGLQQWMKRYLLYDFIKALTVKKPYITDLDGLIKNHLGICQDFSVLFAACARIMGYSTKVVCGYADGSKHAWNEVFLEDEWVTVDMTKLIRGQKTLTVKYKPEFYY